MQLIHTFQNFFDNGTHVVIEGLDAAGRFIRIEIEHLFDGSTVPSEAHASITAQTPQEQTPQEQTPQEQAPQEQTPQEQTPQEQTPQEQTPQSPAEQAGLNQARTPEDGGLDVFPFLAEQAQGSEAGVHHADAVPNPQAHAEGSASDPEATDPVDPGPGADA